MKKAESIKFLLILFLMIGVIGSSNTFSQEDTDLPDEFGQALGLFKIRSFIERPDEFKNIDFIHFDHLPDENMENPRKDGDGNVKVVGWFGTKDKTTYEFATGTLKETKNGEFKVMRFQSVEVNGISYSFSGNFLEERIWEHGGFTSVVGTLIKYKKGVKIASKKFKFYEDAEDDV